MFALYGIFTGAICGYTARESALKLAEPPLSGQKLRIWVLCAAAVCTLCGCVIGGGEVYLPGSFRLITALAALTGATVCDLQGKRIPNLFPLALLCVYLLSGALDWILVPETGAASYIGGLVAGGVLLLLLLLFRGVSLLLFHQQGIGRGDLRLLTALGCVLGLNGAVGTLLAGQIMALLAAAGLIITKKATLKDTLPLAPFLWAGLALNILLQIL